MLKTKTLCSSPLETLLLRQPQRQSYTNARERIFHLQVIVNTLDRDFDCPEIPHFGHSESRLRSPIILPLSSHLKSRILSKLQTNSPNDSTQRRYSWEAYFHRL